MSTKRNNDKKFIDCSELIIQVDILLATYNGEQFLSEQIESIKNQQFSDWRIIVHDDGSSDETLNLLENFKQVLDEKLIIITSDAKAGSAKANFSYLMNYSTAPYVMFCDQDDVWLPNKISMTLERIKKVEQINSGAPVLVHTDLKVVDKDLQLISESYMRFQRLEADWGQDIRTSIVQNTVTGCTAMFNSKLRELAIPVSSSVKMHDQWMLLVCLKNGGIMSFIDEPTILYRQHSNNAVGAGSFTLKKMLLKLGTIFKEISTYIVLAKTLEVKVSILSLVLLKFKIIARRLI